MDADGDVRQGGDVAEITDLLDLTRWPAGMRVIIRRERPPPGAQLSLASASPDEVPSPPRSVRIRLWLRGSGTSPGRCRQR